MSQDYRKRSGASRTKKSSQTPAWVGFVAGLLVGVLITGLAWLKIGELTPESIVGASKEQAEPASQEKPAVAKPRFDFYTILPEMEVVVSAPDVVAEREPPAAAGAAPVEEAGGSYMVQMGSFHKHSDADRMKASLALMGIEADIQKVNVNSGEVFHRVRSTPLSRDEANQLRERLQQQDINSLVVRLRQ
jgi:cell division protein FtsN